MSPAAVELRSSVISPPSECPSAAPQNPELKPQRFDSSFSFPAFCPGDLQGGQQGVSSFSCSDPSGPGLKSASNSHPVARSRPRLAKVRKRVASQHARSKVGPCEVSSSLGNSGCSNDGFVFSGDASKSDGSFVFGANRNGDSNSGERVSTNNVRKESDSGKLENEVFVFGSKLSHRASSSGNECEQSYANCENLVADDGVKTKASWKRENLINVEKLHSGGGRLKMDSVTTDATNNSNEESVPVADTIDLSSTVNAKEGELGKSVGKAGTDCCSNLKTGNDDYLKKSFDSKFVFGNSWFNESTNVGSPVFDFGVKMKAESIAEFQKAEASNVNFSCEEGRTLKEHLGRDAFVFGSSSLNEVMEGRGLNERNLNSIDVRDSASSNVTAGNLESDTNMNRGSTESNNISESVSRPKTIFTLPDEMKNLNINDSGNMNGYEKPECSNTTFTETFSSFKGFEKPSDFSNGCLGNTNFHCSEGLAGFINSTFEDDPESSGKNKPEFQSGFEFSSHFMGGCSSSEPFSFLSGCSVSCDGCQFPQPCVNDTMQPKKATTTSSFSSASFQCQSNDNPYGVPMAKGGKNDKDGPLDTSNNLSSSTEFRIPQWDPSSFKENLFSDLNRNSASSIKNKLNKTKKKKTRGNLRQTNRQDKVSKDDESSQINLDSPGSCTPMDFSPYQETISVDKYSRDMPGESSHLVNNSAPWTPNSTACTNENDEVLLTGRKVTDEYNGTWKCSEPNEESIGHRGDGIYVHSFEGFDSRNETVRSNPITEQSCMSGFAKGASIEPIVTLNLTSDTLESNCGKQSGLEDTWDKSFTFAASSAIQTNLSATKSRHRKKNRKKSDHSVFVISPSPDMKFGSSFEFSSFAGSSLHSEAASNLEAEEKFKPGPSFSTAIQETCEKWRLRYFPERPVLA